MKLILILVLCVFINKISAQGLTKYGQITSSSTSFVDKNGKLGTYPTISGNGNKVWTCGSPLTISHVSGDLVAAETKTVNYGTVLTTLSGSSQCWITQNLGATNQATIVTDNTEASAGWYWQFNRLQGYKPVGTSYSPYYGWVNWIAEGNESSDWTAAQDPCQQQLGSGWRIPTNTEWSTADGAPQNWVNSAKEVVRSYGAA